MKTIKLLAMFLFIGIIAVSCKKEEGPAGPQGPAGTNGTNGNANVKVFGYTKDTLNAANGYALSYSPAGLTAGLIDSSAIFIYYSAYTGQWNMANGFGPSAMYATIQYTDTWSTPYVSVYLENVDGTYYSGSDVVWDSVRVFIIPASTLKVAKQQNINFNNYNEVNTYFDAK